MKIIMEMENLSSLIEEAANNGIEEIVKQQVHDTIKNSVESNVKQQIDLCVGAKVKEWFDDYLANTQIKTGGGWSNEPEKVYTVESYLKEKINESIEKRECIIKAKSSGYSDETVDKSVSFSEYLESKFNYKTYINEKMDKIAKEIKRDVDKTISTSFDSATKQALAENVFNVLMASENYKKVTDSIKRISG